MFRYSVLAVATAWALTACQTTPPLNADLAAASSAVDEARANPYVARTAGVEFDRAQKALQRAQMAWSEDRNVEETRHLAYLATQRARIALAVGSQAQADERIQQAGTLREQAKLQARTREAESATQMASTAQAEAQAAQRQASSQASRAEGLEQDLQALRARNTQRGLVVTLGDVLFDTGKTTLHSGAQKTIDQLVQVLKQYPQRRVRVEGYTDSVGSEESNLLLSRRRAEAFADALVQGGVAADRIEALGWGEGKPLAGNVTAAGRQQNRRVEILFSGEQGQFPGG
jgi:outer membrane protein OmpA-like peptidoglycan-associated protein